MENFHTFVQIELMSTTLPIHDPARTLLNKYESSYRSPIAIVDASEKGLPASTISRVIKLLAVTRSLAEAIFQLSFRTLDNYEQQNKKVNALVSEKALALMALYRKGIELFGSTAEFNKWLGEPAYGLGKKVPRDLLGTMTGIGLVVDELSRIEYGDLA
jgi:putative toxin-antitoxin system antitoxin component (TIGR02293 family)